ncbi:MAG: DMT family transporter [bacterium]|nr:DMT family transporter [bacterium]
MNGSELAAILFGLASAASWGAGDFSGGVASKRASAFSVVIASQIVGVVLFLVLALLTREPFPPTVALLWAAGGGVIGAFGLVALYTALSRGAMGTAAPVAAVMTAAVPVLVGFALEGLPEGIRLLGFTLALIGVWLVSQAGGFELKNLALPLFAGLCFGTYIVFLERAGEEQVLWPLFGARCVSVLVLLIIATLLRQPRFPSLTLLPLTSLVGVLDAGGNAFLVLAAQAGRLDVAAVLSSLYPASTVLLAWLLLRETLGRLQLIGMAAVLVAILLIAA